MFQVESVYGNDKELELKEIIIYTKCLNCGSEIAQYGKPQFIGGKHRRYQLTFTTKEIMMKYCIPCLEKESK